MKTINDYAELVKEKHALNKTIAPVETNETDASRAYAVGEQLIFNGTLYDVIAPISQHDVITTTGSGANIAPAGSISAKIQTLTNKLNGEIETRAKVSAHNFLIFDKAKVIAGNSSGTWSSNVYTINGGTITLSDVGEIVVNGTFTAQTDFAYTKRTTSDLILTPGDYKLVGGINDNISVSGNSTRNGAYYNLGVDTGSGLPFTITSDDAGVGIFVRLLAGAYDNVKVSPMITAPNDSASVFTPYAMTNRELTEKINEEFLQNTASISAQINYKDVYLFTTNGGSSSGSAQYSSAYLVFGQATTQITYFALKEGTEITPSVDGTTFTLTASTSITMAYRKL